MKNLIALVFMAVMALPTFAQTRIPYGQALGDLYTDKLDLARQKASAASKEADAAFKRQKAQIHITTLSGDPLKIAQFSLGRGDEDMTKAAEAKATGARHECESESDECHMIQEGPNGDWEELYERASAGYKSAIENYTLAWMHCFAAMRHYNRALGQK